MSTAPDMTQAQFNAACKRFHACGILGYFTMPETNVSVSVLNAGKRRRDQLAYLIQQQRKVTERIEKDAQRALDLIAGNSDD